LDIHASRFQQPASDSAPKTQDTSGRLSQPELLQCDQVSVSLKTSRDISRWGCPTLSKTWADWVIERRGAWRARVNAARLTRGSGSLSWPTATAFDFNNTPLNRIDGTGKTYKSNLKEAVHQNWPTVRASEYKDVGPVGSKSHDHMLGKHYLCAVVTQDAATNGQAAPASSSSLGSRQGLWPSARPSGSGTHNAMSMKNAWSRIQKTGYRSNLEEALALQHGPSPAKLNPRWVETLMGLPIGWTMPSCTSPQTIAPMSCDSLAMELSLPPQSEPSEFFLAS
jgi:hypothetical protein